MQNKQDEVVAGKKFFDLTLTGNFSFVQGESGRRMYVEAQCKCGIIKSYPLRYLKTGNTKSCGCVRREKLTASRVTHHLSRNPLYSVYQDMNRRCYDTRCSSFKDYGGRGISVCDEWRNDIHSFIEWANLNGYSKGLEIDRGNNDGNYEPNNCRFVTRAVGNTNTRRTKQVVAFGESKTAAEWSRDERCKINKKALTDRLKSGKWSIEDAITLGGNEKKKEIARNSNSAKKVKAFGEEKSVIEWSEDGRCTVGYSGLKARINNGWDYEKAISHPKE